MKEREPVLRVQDLRVRYGGVEAVSGLSCSIQRGEILGLIGPNGAGKTSAIDAMTGYAPVAGGSVWLREQNVTRMPAHLRARAGIIRTFQQLELFNDLSVYENLLMSARSTHRGTDATVDQSLEVFGFSALRDTAIAELPQGTRRLIAIARAYAASPDVLLLDEPAAGLDEGESKALHGGLRTLAGRGIGILLVEHDMAFVMKICDRLVVLEFGKTIGEGTPLEIRNDLRVVEAYLGVSDI